ncbi:hypothetical protein [Halobellus salinisoli]|uniref:hypothetical protein n=1 Tax=Halobellus salinisoli TaxID=3108500 RepID=UPI003CE59772
MLHSITDFEGALDTTRLGATGYDATGLDASTDAADHGTAKHDRSIAGESSRTQNVDADELTRENADADEPRRAASVDTGDSNGPQNADTGGGRRSRRAVLGYALLFSVPVGVGVAVMLLQVTRGRPTDALVFGPSLALAAAVFVLLVAIGWGGSPEP